MKFMVINEMFNTPDVVCSAEGRFNKRAQNSYFFFTHFGRNIVISGLIKIHKLRYELSA